MKYLNLKKMVTGLMVLVYCHASFETKKDESQHRALRGTHNSLLQKTDVTERYVDTIINQDETETSSDHILTILGQIQSSDRSERTDSNILIGSRVVGGNDAPQDRFRYMVSLTNANGSHVCGGSLITSNLVLTAAHCQGHFIEANIGRYNTNINENYEVFNIIGEVIHPQFDSILLRDDFMIVRLDGHSSYPTITLNEDKSDNVPASIYVIGWGVTGSDAPAYRGPLQETDLNYIPNNVCSQSTGYIDDQYGSYYGLIIDSMLCATRTNTDSCFGDSGGPLIIKGENSENDIQIGIVSWGFGCAHNSFPGVYARVSDQIEWIKEVVCILSSGSPAGYDCTARRRRPVRIDTCTGKRQCSNGLKCIHGKCRSPK